MFVLLNGSFGIGKTTLAKRLARAVPGAAISDPEHVGYVLQRLPAPLLGLKSKPGDYQDMALWRRLIVTQARLTHWRARVVIVPMAFTDRGYFSALEEGLGKTAPVLKLCLVASLSVVRARLDGRAAAEGRALGEFEIRRSAECVAAHEDSFFGLPLDATGSTDVLVQEVASMIAAARSGK